MFQLKYFDGAKPGLKRKNETPPDQRDQKAKEKSRKYEEHRAERKLNENWKKGREWLLFNLDDQTMSCSICIDYSKLNGPDLSHSNLKGNNTFITGCSNRRVSAIVDHENSKGHKSAMLRHAAKNSSVAEKAKSDAGKALKILKSSERHRLAYLFRNAHAVARHNRPLTDYNWLCSTDKAKGLDLGDSYLNEKAAVCFLSCISGTIQEKTAEVLIKAPFFSFIMDGSTDISGDEQECVFIRVCQKGKVEERFLEMGTPKSTSSQDLFIFLVAMFDRHKINKEKLIGMGSDGASNMVGCKSGLATLLRQNVNSEMVNVHCMCHRLELSFRDVMKDISLYDKLMTLLIGLNYFYMKSYKNKKGLLTSMEALNVKGTLPPKVTGTRWLPHLSRSVESLFKTYRAYEAHLSTLSHDNPKAEGLLKLLLNRNLLTFTIFLKDTIEPLMGLSKRLQKADITLADSYLWIQTTADLVEEAFIRNSDQLTEVLETGMFSGITLKGPQPEMGYRENMVKGIADALKSRFELNSGEQNIVKSTNILNIKHWPEDEEELKAFGSEEVNFVTTHFKDTLLRTVEGFTTEKATSEWQFLKRALYRRYGDKISELTWRKICTEFGEDCGHFLLVVDLLLTLPPTSVLCETTFSQMKLIKTSRRTRMRQSTLNDLMVVKIMSEDVDSFNPDEAIDRWLADSSMPRRPDYKRSKPIMKQQLVEADTDVTDSDSDLESDNEENEDNSPLLIQKFIEDQTEKENNENILLFLRD